MTELRALIVAVMGIGLILGLITPRRVLGKLALTCIVPIALMAGLAAWNDLDWKSRLAAAAAAALIGTVLFVRWLGAKELLRHLVASTIHDALRLVVGGVLRAATALARRLLRV